MTDYEKGVRDQSIRIRRIIQEECTGVRCDECIYENDDHCDQAFIVNKLIEMLDYELKEQKNDVM